MRSAVNEFAQFLERKHYSKIKVHESSIIEKDRRIFFLIREKLERKLVILIPQPPQVSLISFVFEEKGDYVFQGEKYRVWICPCNHENACALRETFPFTKPKAIGLQPAIGTGDRIGLATPGHIKAAKELNVFPVLAQQSIREMDRTSRTPYDVLDDASWAVFQVGYKGGFAADADHLKTLRDIDITFKAGFTMYTIDPSDYVDNEAENYGLSTLREKFKKLPWDELEYETEQLVEEYLKQRYEIRFPDGTRTFRFSEESLLRAAVKYSAAVAHAAKMYRYMKNLFGSREFDVEVSVDETKTPTSPLEHIFIVSELSRLGVKFTGLALRFVGRFEKAIDYIGDLREFEESFKTHVYIARTYGPYKLSIHSGSDKFSIYPIVGKIASEMIHLKTAGTSYLEALRVVARHDPNLFREIVQYSFGRFEEDRRSYDVSTDLSVVPNPSDVPDDRLETVFLDENNGRQLLHITYGSVLTAKKDTEEWLFRDRLKKLLIENEKEHYETVYEHIKKHIRLLWAGDKKE
ncbi:hypothetical protein B6U79_04250 [Candidatus Bathyarchaeota archaeon ex4484_231]|nr:MAG: hypothetical protein B6U79_04250 [Candidatus Bathyarchaeota archaeon ex4484_231]